MVTKSYAPNYTQNIKFFLHKNGGVNYITYKVIFRPTISYFVVVTKNMDYRD